MSATPEQFLNSAISLLDAADGSEICFRNSASRAYYAAFHCCYSERSRCPNLNDADIWGSHDKLYKRFENLPNTVDTVPLKQMAYMAKMMKSVRHKADYRLHEDFDRSDAAQQVTDARVVLKHWRSLQLPPRP